MTQLRHRNIVRVVNAGLTREDIPRPYYVMDEEPGALTLSELIVSRTPLAVSNVLTIGIQVCDALHKVHTLAGPNGELLGAVHRDLKPGNLLIMKDDDGKTIVKLLDFGIAWALYLVVQGAVERTFHGTVAYAAPEQHIGRALLQSDLYSLAVVLYELFAERHPFWDAKDVNDMMALHRFIKVRPLTTYVVGLPPSLVALIAKNLEKDPTKRSRSAAELKAELIECAREVEGMKRGRAIDLATTDNQLIEKKVEERKVENDRCLESTLAIVAERTGSSASSGLGWYHTDPGGPPRDPSPGLASVALPAQGPGRAAPTQRAGEAIPHARPAAGAAASVAIEGLREPRIVRGINPPSGPFVIPPVNHNLSATDQNPPRPEAPGPRPETLTPTPSQRKKTREAETSERPVEDLVPPPTERLNPDGSTKKHTGTTPLGELVKIEPDVRRTSTAVMVDAPGLPWYAKLSRGAARFALTVRHPVRAWQRSKARREIAATEPERRRGPVASGRIAKGLIVLAAVVGVLAFAWFALQRRDRGVVADPSHAGPVVTPSSSAGGLAPAPSSTAEPAAAALSAAANTTPNTTPNTAANMIPPSPVNTSSPSNASPGIAVPSVSAGPHPSAGLRGPVPKGPTPLGTPRPKVEDRSVPAFPPSPKRTPKKSVGESPNVEF